MYYLTPIIVFLGFIIGFLVKKYIPEEKKLIKKYSFYLEKILLFLIIIAIIYFTFNNSIWFYLFFITGIILGIFFREKYLYFGLALLTFDMFVSVLLFLFGIVNGNKSYVKTAIFFFIPFLLLLFNIEFTSLVILSSGALFSSFFTNNKLLNL